MGEKQFRLRYLPLFEQELNEIIDYIAFDLQNPDAADQLLSDIQEAILKRLDRPTAFEAFHSVKERRWPYYRISVKNYYVFYVVMDDVMEVRRVMYSGRNWKKKL